MSSHFIDLGATKKNKKRGKCVIMKDVCFKEAYEKYGQYEDWYRSANYCAGYNCPEYANCKARKEFDDLPKYGVTDYEMEEAANKECMYGVWDRETNNY